MGKGITEGNEKPLKELGVMISTCRKIRGLSQEELAKKAGISRSLISAIEAAGLAHNFTLDVLFNIADALGVEAKDLLGGEWQTALKEYNYTAYFHSDRQQRRSRCCLS